jgi:hypothetical protein
MSRSIILCVVAIVLGLPLTAMAEQKKEQTHPIYEVWAKHSKTSKPWYLDYFHEKEKAEERIRQIRYDHFDKEGLLYSDPDKPLDLHIVEKRCSCKRWPSRSPAERPSDPPGRSGPRPGGTTKNPLTVKVYKRANGERILDEERTKTFSTYAAASNYFSQMVAAGSEVEWDAPGWPRPLGELPQKPWVDVKPYSPPAEDNTNRPEKDAASIFVGEWKNSRGQVALKIESDGTTLKLTGGYAGDQQEPIKCDGRRIEIQCRQSINHPTRYLLTYQDGKLVGEVWWYNRSWEEQNGSWEKEYSIILSKD